MTISRERYTRLNQIEVDGIGSRDKVILSTFDFSAEDQTLFLPLWAGMPDPPRARAIVEQNLRDGGRFFQPYGICACPPVSGHRTETTVCHSVHMPWNHIIGEGLLAYGLKQEAVRLVGRLMSAVIGSLKGQHAFYSQYHALNGAGMGVRNAVSGLAPLGLFLKTLGVQILSDQRVRLSWLNPFPWSVEIRHRSLVINCHADRTEIVFPDGQEITVSDSLPCVVSAG